MKALSLTQPWAQLMADGRKKIETRSWRPPTSMINQPIAIHASAGWSGIDRDCAEAAGYNPATLPRGCIVAVVRLLRVEETNYLVQAGISEDEYSFGNFEPGRWGWVCSLEGKLALPVRARGALGLWFVDAELEASVRSQLGAGAVV